MQKFITLIALSTLLAASIHAEQPSQDQRLFVSVTGSSLQDQAMPLVLANQALDQGAEVRVLLCGEGGKLAVAGHELETFAPRNITPRDLLGRLIHHGVQVEVCAIFLPNTEYVQSDLIEGVGTANPADVVAWMMAPDTRILSH